MNTFIKISVFEDIKPTRIPPTNQTALSLATKLPLSSQDPKTLINTDVSCGGTVMTSYNWQAWHIKEHIL